MKKIILFFIIILLPTMLLADSETKCETKLQKLKPSCNAIGSVISKMKKFSEKNQTLDQSFKNVKEKVKEVTK